MNLHALRLFALHPFFSGFFGVLFFLFVRLFVFVCLFVCYIKAAIRIGIVVVITNTDLDALPCTVELQEAFRMK